MSYFEYFEDMNEPNLVKCKFMLNNQKTFSLEFDHKIEIKQLKEMISIAVKLRRNTFKLLYKGIDYSDCNEDSFHSLFNDTPLETFVIEPKNEEQIKDETEIVIRMESWCPFHSSQFLTHYCFNCNKSICSECLINGIHKEHKIQDKCFYLLNSKNLVEKMFPNWPKNPYDEIKSNFDVSSLKQKVNDLMFKKLYDMIDLIRQKMITLIENTDIITRDSLENLRDSVRNVKASCFKALNNLKEKINIKDIVNDEKIFIKFDSLYKEMINIENDNFKKNLNSFKELNSKSSLLIPPFIDNVYSSIFNILKDLIPFNHLHKYIIRKISFFCFIFFMVN